MNNNHTLALFNVIVNVLPTIKLQYYLLLNSEQYSLN